MTFIIEEALFQILSEGLTIRSFVGDRIYGGELPENCKFPAITFFNISDPYENQFAAGPRFQIDVWSLDYLEARKLKNAIKSYVEGFSGIVGGLTIIRIIPDNAPDEFQSGARLYHIPFDVIVNYRTL